MLLSPSYSRARVGLATVGFILLSLIALLILPAIFPADKDLLAHYGLAPKDPRTQSLSGQIDNLRSITAVIALTTLACGYWLALLRLREVSGPQALLETIWVERILFFIGGEYVLITVATLISPDLGKNTSGIFWWTAMLATAPELLLIGFVIGVVGGGMMLYAVTRHAPARRALPGRYRLRQDAARRVAMGLLLVGVFYYGVARVDEAATLDGDVDTQAGQPRAIERWRPGAVMVSHRAQDADILFQLALRKRWHDASRRRIGHTQAYLRANRQRSPNPAVPRMPSGVSMTRLGRKRRGST